MWFTFGGVNLCVEKCRKMRIEKEKIADST